MKLKGFSLIELMIVIAIIGILASIAIPSYQNYIYRSKFSEIISTASAISEQVNEYVQEQDTAPATPTAPACTSIVVPTIATTNNVLGTSLTIASATCVITLKGTTTAFPTQPTVTLTPTQQTDGSVTWACTSGSKYAPSTCP